MIRRQILVLSFLAALVAGVDMTDSLTTGSLVLGYLFAVCCGGLGSRVAAIWDEYEFRSKKPRKMDPYLGDQIR